MRIIFSFVMTALIASPLTAASIPVTWIGVFDRGPTHVVPSIGSRIEFKSNHTRQMVGTLEEEGQTIELTAAEHGGTSWWSLIENGLEVTRTIDLFIHDIAQGQLAINRASVSDAFSDFELQAMSISVVELDYSILTESRLRIEWSVTGVGNDESGFPVPTPSSMILLSTGALATLIKRQS